MRAKSFCASAVVKHDKPVKTSCDIAENLEEGFPSKAKSFRLEGRGRERRLVMSICDIAESPAKEERNPSIGGLGNFISLIAYPMAGFLP